MQGGGTEEEGRERRSEEGREGGRESVSSRNSLVAKRETIMLSIFFLKLCLLLILVYYVCLVCYKYCVFFDMFDYCLLTPRMG